MRSSRTPGHVTVAGQYTEESAHAFGAVACRCCASGHLPVAEFVFLIVVPKASGRTRRCSLEMGTLRRPCSGMGLRARRAFHAASIGGRPVMVDMEVIVRRQDQEHSASITCMIRHYVARRAKVIFDHPHNAEMSACPTRTYPATVCLLNLSIGCNYV